MDFSQLKRNKQRILSALHQDPKGGLIAKEDLSIVFPVRFEESNLAVIAGDVYTIGIFAIIVGNEYATNNVPSRIRLLPAEINKVKFNEADYYVLTFEKGATITENMNLVMEETIGYYIYNNFIALGKVPWYMSNLDMINLFENMKTYSGKEYGATPAVLQMIISMVMRNSDDVQQYWRQTLTNPNDVLQKPAEYIPLRNVPLGARNTTAKLMGAYFSEGLNSALVNPSENTERIEEILRQ